MLKALFSKDVTLFGMFEIFVRELDLVTAGWESKLYY